MFTQARVTVVSCTISLRCRTLTVPTTKNCFFLQATLHLLFAFFGTQLQNILEKSSIHLYSVVEKLFSSEPYPFKQSCRRLFVVSTQPEYNGLSYTEQLPAGVVMSIDLSYAVKIKAGGDHLSAPTHTNCRFSYCLFHFPTLSLPPLPSLPLPLPRARCEVVSSSFKRSVFGKKKKVCFKQPYL